MKIYVLMTSELSEEFISQHLARATAIMADQGIESAMRHLIAFAKAVPHPSQGQTLRRWKILAQVSGIDVSLAKWFESHLDALSILHELGVTQIPDGVWAVWAAEGGLDPVTYHNSQCNGVKPWCSGAEIVDYGLMTYRDSADHSQLLAIDMQEPGIQVDKSQWNALGMANTATASIQLTRVKATRVGEANVYLQRPGFWHGGAGVAACWYGATVAIARYLLSAYQNKPHYYKALYLGEISTQLLASQFCLKAVAQCIDDEPTQSHEYKIRILRAQIERTAHLVLDRVGQALGAAPFCQSAAFAQLVTDLPVFLRQTHGAFDLEQIGQLAATQEDLWVL